MVFALVLFLAAAQHYAYPDDAKECITAEGIPVITNGVVTGCWWPQNNPEGPSKDCAIVETKKYGRALMCGQVYDEKDVVELPKTVKQPPPCERNCT